MIKKYLIKDAEGNLPDILSEVENGTLVHLTAEDGHTAAVMMPLGEYHRLAHGWRPAPRVNARSSEEIVEGFQEAFKADGCTLEGWLDGIRGEWKGRGV